MTGARVPVGLAAALLLAVLAGCGPAGPGESTERATESVRDAYLATVNAGTARVGLRAELTAEVAGRTERAQLTGDARFDFTRQTSQASIVTPLGITVEVRTVGVHFYEKAPAQLRKRFPGSRPWMHFDFEAADRAQYGGPLYVFRPDGPDDPWQMLGFLPAATSARLVGAETLAGARVRHYRAEVRLADLAAAGGDRTGPGRRQFQQKVGLDSVPIEVWLDGNGRLRRLRTSVPLRLRGAEWTGTDAEVTGRAMATQDFSEFGAAVSVDAPPAADTDDLTGLVAERGLAAVGEIVGIL